MNTFYNYLSKRLKSELPGHEAQLKMAPRPNEGRRPTMPETEDVNIGGVFILLHEKKDNNYEVLLTLRSQDLPTHKGQLSFPGGRADNDESIIETALRELEEEVGIPPDKVNVLGRITSLYIPNSRNFVHPVVGFIQQKPPFKINPAEVSEAFFVDLDTLSGPKFRCEEDWVIRDRHYKVPYWDIHPSTPLWGATAMIMSEFMTLYKEYKSQDPNQF